VSKEKRAPLIDTLKIAKEATQFAIKRMQRAKYENGRMPMGFLDKVAFVAVNLKPDFLRRNIRVLSSMRYGRHVFDCAFPRFENLDDYGSNEWSVNLSDRPVQVLGWAEREEMFQQGVRQGLEWTWIDTGWYERSLARGIDEEFHFARFAPEPGTRPKSFVEQVLEAEQKQRLLDQG